MRYVIELGKRYDLILADECMEALNGSDAIAKLHTKVVILSSDGMFVSDAGFLVKDGRYAHETDI